MTQITHRVRADTSAPRTSRLYLDGIRDELGSKFDDVALIVSELVSNSVRHAGGDVTLNVDSSGPRIRIEVSDAGPGFEPDVPRRGGMGLDIIDRLAEAWGVISDGTCTVWVELLADNA